MACGWNADKQQIASATAPTQAEAEAEIKATLNRLSCQFVGIEAAITLFLRCFPAGFTDPFYLYDERTYKLRAVTKARDLLSEDRLDALLATGNHRQVLDDAARAMRVNLVQPYEQMAFGAAIQQPAVIEALPGLLRAMLYGDDFATALDEASTLLAAHIGVWTQYDFIPAPGDGVPRLFRINIASNMDYWDQFWAAYTEKYGKPAKIQKGKVQNKLGAGFDAIIAVWGNKESTITLEQRTTAINHMGITYVHTALYKAYTQRRVAIEGRPADKL